MNSRTHGREIYVDFGVTKPHAVLTERSRRPSLVDDLGSLGLRDARVYLEEGRPRMKLAKIAEDNRLFVIDGRIVKEFRKANAVVKSDADDAAIIRELARQTPDAFRELDPREKREIVGHTAYGYYCHLTGLIATLKNRQKAFEREFGSSLPQIDAALRTLEREKKVAMQFFSKYSTQVKRLDIRGMGPRILGGILLKASPARFPSLSAYLGYCGLKGHAISGGRYSRHVRALYHQLATSTIMHKDPEFYGLYQKVKGNLRERFPDYSGTRIEGMTKNRLATFLAKRVFSSARATANGTDRTRK